MAGREGQCLAVQEAQRAGRRHGVRRVRRWPSGVLLARDVRRGFTWPASRLSEAGIGERQSQRGFGSVRRGRVWASGDRMVAAYCSWLGSYVRQHLIRIEKKKKKRAAPGNRIVMGQSKGGIVGQTGRHGTTRHGPDWARHELARH